MTLLEDMAESIAFLSLSWSHREYKIRELLNTAVVYFGIKEERAWKLCHHYLNSYLTGPCEARGRHN